MLDHSDEFNRHSEHSFGPHEAGRHRATRLTNRPSVPRSLPVFPNKKQGFPKKVLAII
jgi:hypothetical protein